MDHAQEVHREPSNLLLIFQGGTKAVENEVFFECQEVLIDMEVDRVVSSNVSSPVRG